MHANQFPWQASPSETTETVTIRDHSTTEEFKLRRKVNLETMGPLTWYAGAGALLGHSSIWHHSFLHRLLVSFPFTSLDWMLASFKANLQHPSRPLRVFRYLRALTCTDSSSNSCTCILPLTITYHSNVRFDSIYFCGIFM